VIVFFLLTFSNVFIMCSSWFVLSALRRCLSIDCIKNVSCSNKPTNAAFLSGPEWLLLILSNSSWRHSKIEKNNYLLCQKTVLEMANEFICTELDGFSTNYDLIQTSLFRRNAKTVLIVKI